MKRRTLVALLILVLAAGYALADEKRFSVPLGDSPATGPANAPVTIVEFIDFQ
jgi:protein-disulfide isomerase